MASTVEFPVVSSLFRNGSRGDFLDINQGLFRSSSVQSNLVQQSKLSTADRPFSSQERITASPKPVPKKAGTPKNGLKSKSEAVVQSAPLRNGSNSSLSGSLLAQFKNNAPRPRYQSPLARTTNGIKPELDARRRASGGNCHRDILSVSNTRSMTPDRVICGNALTIECRKFAAVTVKISTKVEESSVITSEVLPQQNGNTVSENPSVQAISSDVLQELLNAAVMRVLMLDCRGFTSYNVNHIVGALNVSCADCISRKRLTCGKATVGDMINGGEEAKNKYKTALSDEKVQLLVYDDSTTDFDGLSATHPLKVVLNNLRKSGYDAYYLHGGLEAFSKKYSSMCSAEAEPSPKPLLYSPTNNVIDSNIDTAVISQILPQLYVGNERDASNRDTLKEHGITHILNVTSQIPLHFETASDLIYKRLPASDSGNQNLKQYFDEALRFIDDASSSGGRVLIHCQAGVSRSATIAIAYIMARLKMGMLDAFRFVKTRRPIVAPNFNFMGQLLEFETKLFGQKDAIPNGLCGTAQKIQENGIGPTREDSKSVLSACPTSAPSVGRAHSRVESPIKERLVEKQKC